MKLKIPLLAALLAMIPICGNGFTLDAVGYNGAALSENPASIHVAGYGEVIFEPEMGGAIMLSSAYLNETLPPNPDIDFDMKDAVKVLLNGRETRPVDLVLAGVSGPENREKIVASLLSSVGGGVNQGHPTPQRVPETASALLGLLGTAFLLLRRLR